MAFPGVAAYSAPGYANNWIPGYAGDADGQKKLIIGYTMNEERFALPNYCTVLGSDVPRAFYARYYNADFVRIPQANGYDRYWADGADLPGAGEAPRFTHEEFQMRRYGTEGKVGYLAENFSQIGSMVQTLQNTYASQAMIFRSILAQTEMTTSGNYPSGNYYADWGDLANDATTQGYPAGYFGTAGTNMILDGTINDPLIKKLFDHASNKILIGSNGNVQPQDLIALMNPNTAGRLANTQEIRAFNAQQSGSINYTQGKAPFEFWPTRGLPNPLYGFKLLVDSTIKAAAKQDHANADTRAFVIPDGQITFLSRPGAVAGMPGSSPFSSLVLWQYKKDAMRPETKNDEWHERILVKFKDFFAIKLVGGDISFNVTDVFTATV